MTAAEQTPKAANRFKTVMVNAALMVLSTFFILGVAEAGMRLAHKLLPKQNVTTMLSGGPAGFISQYDGKLGWRSAPHYSFKRLQENSVGKQYTVSYATEENGFRFYDQSQRDKKRVFVLGDSFTEAVQASNDKTYYGVLRRELPIAVFSYGASGYSTLQEYLFLDEQIDAIQPDVIIWQFASNDIVNNSYELQRRSLVNLIYKDRPYLMPDGRIELKNQLTGLRWQLKSFAYNHSYFLDTVMESLDKLAARYIPSVEAEIMKKGRAVPGYSSALQVTDRILTMVRQRAGDTPIIAFCADGRQPFYQDLKKMALQHGFIWSDGVQQILQEAEKQGAVIVSDDLSHWSEQGHAYVAKDLKKILEPLLSGAR